MIKVEQQHLTHKGGTKDYDLYIFNNQDTGSILWGYRYGKVATVGQMKVSFVASMTEAREKVQNKLNEKTSYKKGYKAGPLRQFHKEDREFFQEFSAIDSQIMNRFLSKDLREYSTEAKKTAAALGVETRSAAEIYKDNSQFGIF